MIYERNYWSTGRGEPDPRWAAKRLLFFSVSPILLEEMKNNV